MLDSDHIEKRTKKVIVAIFTYQINMPHSRTSVSTRQLTLTSQSLGSLAQESNEADGSSTSSGSSTEVDADYENLMSRIRQQNEEIRQLQSDNRQLAEELDQERSLGAKQLQELEAAAKLAERQIQELSAELVRSREAGKRAQHAYETRAIRMHEDALRDPFEERRRLDMRLQQLELDADRMSSELRGSSEERAKQRDVIRQAEADRDAAQRLYEASERERAELKVRIGELSRRTRLQETRLSSAAQDWLRKNRQLGVMREDVRWKKIESRVTHKLDMGSTATYELPKAAYLPKRLAQSLGDAARRGGDGGGASGSGAASGGGVGAGHQKSPEPQQRSPQRSTQKSSTSVSAKKDTRKTTAA